MSTVIAMSAVTLSCLTLACSHVVQPGLANAPANPTTPSVYAGIHDVIANGPESCSRRPEPGGAAYRLPPCPTSTGPALQKVPISGARPVTGSTPMQWLEHYHSRWSCRFGFPGVAEEGMIDWLSPVDDDASACAWP